jgi:hypothetical protein
MKMKNRILATIALTAMLALPAQAEFRQAELKIFGMD